MVPSRRPLLELPIYLVVPEARVVLACLECLVALGGRPAEISDALSSGSWLVDVFSLLSNETEIELPELGTSAIP